MITVEITRTYSNDRLQEYSDQGMYINQPYEAIKQMIFEEMLMQTLPMKITIDKDYDATETEIQT